MHSRSIFSALALMAIATCALQAQTLSYRTYQSPVKDQARRGTCTAFAVVAAMETFDGVPQDLSEQHIYMRAKLNHWEEMKAMYDEGASFRFYVDVLKVSGTVNEETSPYVPTAPIWEKNADAFEKMKKDIQASSAMEMFSIPKYSYKLHNDLIQYVDGGSARNVAWIKARLDEGVKAIPVGYAINGDYWGGHDGKADGPMSPADFLMVEVDGKWMPYGDAREKDARLNARLHAGEMNVLYPDTLFRPDGGHAVTIVGYNENGFLIKNSWGETWGDKGYGWVSFDYHELFCNEALIIRSIMFASRENKELVPTETGAWRLKVIPHQYVNKALGMSVNGASLSLTWHGKEAPLPLKEVHYTIEDGSGSRIEDGYGYVSGIFNDGSKFGYPVNLLDKKFNSLLPTTYTVRVKCTTQTGAVFNNTYSLTTGKSQEVKPM